MTALSSVEARSGAAIGASPDLACRLCGADTERAFGLVVLGKHDVAYLRCRGCGSLQTEPPYWLQEAYAGDAGGEDANLADLDTGAAQRNMMSLAATLWVAERLKLRNVIDHGGGDGLLVRLLRDYGVNAYVTDRYAAASYARGFTTPDFARPDLITAFEVFEHFANPRVEAGALFDQQPAAILVSTEIYCDQGPDWWYLVAQTGQHVFFYSERGMALLAERFGYALLRAGAYTLFVKPERLRQAKALKLGLRYRALKIFRSTIMLRPAPGVSRDFDRLKLQNGAAPAPGETRNG